MHCNDACMNMSCLHYGIHLQQTYCLLSDIHGEVHKVMNIKDVFWSVIMNMCIRLDNDLKQCVIKQAMHFMLPSKATVRYPKLTHSCCL